MLSLHLEINTLPDIPLSQNKGTFPLLCKYRISGQLFACIMLKCLVQKHLPNIIIRTFHPNLTDYILI